MSELTVECFPEDDFFSDMYLMFTPESLVRHEACAVDPSRSEIMAERLRELGIERLTIFITHEHYDHTLGINALRSVIPAQLICQSYAGERIKNPRNNRPLSFLSPGSGKLPVKFEPYVCEADITFDDELKLDWHGMSIRALHTPGHTAGSCCIFAENAVFTGDSLIPDEPAMTRFFSGSAADYEKITLPILKSIPPDITVYPGHGKAFRMGSAVFDGECFRVSGEGGDRNGI